MWLVAIAGNFSAIWILLANGFMQHPVGYTIRNGRAELTDFIALITNKHGWLEIIHVVPAALLLGSFFIMGVSAYHLLKKQHVEIFQRSFKIGLVVGLITALSSGLTGDMHGINVSKTQPAKLAAMEAHWETQTQAPIILFALPAAHREENIIEIGSIPGLLSFLGFHDFNAEVTGLKDIPEDERPPVFPTFVGFRTMVGIGTLMILLMIYGWFQRNRLMENPRFLKIMLWSIPLPYIATEAGWIVSEVGRQPWIVYGLMRTSEAGSPIAFSQVAISLIGFIVVYGLLGAVGFYLIAKSVKEGPEAETN